MGAGSQRRRCLQPLLLPVGMPVGCLQLHWEEIQWNVIRLARIRHLVAMDFIDSLRASTMWDPEPLGER